MLFPPLYSVDVLWHLVLRSCNCRESIYIHSIYLLGHYLLSFCFGVLQGEKCVGRRTLQGTTLASSFRVREREGGRVREREHRGWVLCTQTHPLCTQTPIGECRCRAPFPLFFVYTIYMCIIYVYLYTHTHTHTRRAAWSGEI